jgi:hypothetical protein
MPNWCYNYLSVEGPQEQIDKLKVQLNTPFEQSHDSWNPESGNMEFKTVKYSEPVFAFHNIYNHIQDGVTFDVYHNSSNNRDPNMSVDEAIAQIADEMANGQSWYDWNCRNWGTKWDVAVADGEQYSDTEIYDEQDNSIGYKFHTAWSPPFPAMEKLSMQYPDLEFSLSYEEETGWGGEALFINGNQENVDEYGWKCIECDHTEEETPWCETCDFDMCPSCGHGEPMDEDREQCEEHREEANA